MRVRFLLGPAGSGKTFRCLTEVRQALSASQEGPPLLLVAPKQATYQLEQQFLADPSMPGYTRLHILSFERLAHFVFERLGKASPDMLDDEGRVMVLRGLLAKKRDDLKLFRASARLTGFAQQLSLVLRELQHHQQTPESLHALAGQARDNEGLACKLHDLATLLRSYLDWLDAHTLQDADCLLPAATEAIENSKPETRNPNEVRSPKSEVRSTESVPQSPQSTVHGPQSEVSEHATRNTQHALHFDGLWVDGFAELSPQELDLLAALLPHCEQATMAFCLDGVPGGKLSWLSTWSVVSKSFEDCRKRLGSLPDAETTVEVLPRHPTQSRFVNNPVLAHLESHWSDPQPYPSPMPLEPEAPDAKHSISDFGLRTSDFLPPSDFGFRPSFGFRISDFGFPLRLFTCLNPDAEVTLAAREILRHVRAGGRFRDVSVVVRKLESYHDSLQRVFSRYEIPFFLDRRESVSHHPLAELTRSALRTVASQWMRDDWFAALKTGLVPVEETDIDRLENEALARGWKGAVWQKPIVVTDDPQLTAWLAGLHERLLPPFQRLALAVASNRPTGQQLAAALREFWITLNVEERLQQWAEAESSSSEHRIPSSVHATVWDQMNVWLGNVELAFSTEALPLREWLPILEAGLAGLTVGVIPPALDQVMIGAIDRSRNPDIKLALVLGLNETVFPAAPETTLLLSDTDRIELEKQNLVLGGTARQQLSRERYYAYIACTRARERVVLTSALHDANGSPLNPSPFLSQVQRLFPSLKLEMAPRSLDWRESEHVSELIGPVLRVQSPIASPQSTVHSPQSEVRSPKSEVQGPNPEITQHMLATPEREVTRSTLLSTLHAPRSTLHALLHIPALASILEQLRHFQTPQTDESLSPELAAQLYGPVLHTSVSRMEQFAACPFKFFVHSGLRAEERKLYELDSREQGSFQHDALALFHQQLRAEHKRWRDITPSEARERIAATALGLMASYRDGLLQASEQSRFMARVLTESLQDFAETLVGWMREQYRFEPVEVELPFGEDESSPAWGIELRSAELQLCADQGATPARGAGDPRSARLELYGRIDRVDLYRDPATDEALCVVVDYKSSHKQLDPVLVEHGLQLQLLTYLNVLRHWPNPRERFGAARLVPAGVFYVSLRGKYDREPNRLDALANTEEARKKAYRHAGRFDARVLRLLDARPDARQGDQFSYRLTNDGQVYKNSREALATAEFEALLDSVETNLRRMGGEIFSGVAKVAPYRRGTTTACDQCVYRSICRIDPWTHSFRALKAEAE